MTHWVRLSACGLLALTAMVLSRPSPAAAQSQAYETSRDGRSPTRTAAWAEHPRYRSRDGYRKPAPDSDGEDSESLSWSRPRRHVVRAQAIEEIPPEELPPEEGFEDGPDLLAEPGFAYEGEPVAGPPCNCPNCSGGPLPAAPHAPCAAPVDCCDHCNVACCCPCDACGDCSDTGCPGDGCVCINWKHNLSLFVGTHGFKGPRDAGINGNFGFHEGLNWGTPLFRSAGIGAQLGALSTHSNLSGSLFEGTDNNRDQTFATAGLFRRCAHGWQWGVAYDRFNDDYYDHVDLDQWRVELSYVCPNGRELGFTGMVSGDSDQVTVPQRVADLVGVTELRPTWEPTQQYRIFYRRSLCNGAAYRLWGGASDQGDGLVGGDVFVPVSGYLALTADFTYLSPEEGDGRENAVGSAGFQQESWNLAFRVVWYPGGLPRFNCACPRGRYAPLFDVANNGSFLVDHFGAVR